MDDHKITGYREDQVGEYPKALVVITTIERRPRKFVFNYQGTEQFDPSILKLL